MSRTRTAIPEHQIDDIRMSPYADPPECWLVCNCAERIDADSTQGLKDAYFIHQREVQNAHLSTRRVVN